MIMHPGDVTEMEHAVFKVCQPTIAIHSHMEATRCRVLQMGTAQPLTVTLDDTTYLLLRLSRQHTQLLTVLDHDPHCLQGAVMPASDNATTCKCVLQHLDVAGVECLPRKHDRHARGVGAQQLCTHTAYGFSQRNNLCVSKEGLPGCQSRNTGAGRWKGLLWLLLLRACTYGACDGRVHCVCCTELPAGVDDTGGVC